MIVYGMKMISLDDIIANTFIGRPDDICNYLKVSIGRDPKYADNLECKAIVDTSRQGNLPMINMVQPYKLLFSPVDYVESNIISSEMFNCINTIKKKIIIPKDIKEMDKLLSKYEERDLDFKTKYKDSDSIFSVNCFMFVFNEVFIEVYTVRPIILLKEMLLKTQDYVCVKCLEKKKFNNELPDMMYKLIENEIEYFCNKCSKNIEGLKHIGE